MVRQINVIRIKLKGVGFHDQTESVHVCADNRLPTYSDM